MDYELYALYLKEGKSCDIKYGRRTYDYQEGTIVCFAPGQVVEVSMPEEEFQPKVYGLLFHPDLIRGTSLGKAIDKHSKQLIAMHIELLLNYCLRFYERQFITREKENIDILQKFEKLIASYWNQNLQQEHGLPSVKYFADKVCLSSNYFGDLIKKETGKSPQEYIHFKLIERAKNRILHSDLSMSEIAYELGFRYPQHFGRLFKKSTGLTPNEYRVANETTS